MPGLRTLLLSATRITATLWLLSTPALGSATEPRDGRLFDPGVSMKEPADGAPEELAKLRKLVGDWNLQQELHRPGQEVLRSSGRARVTFMNRGHALMERLRIDDFDGAGHPMAAMTFFAVDGNGTWTASEGNSWTESLSVASGELEGDSLVLHDALRPGGGILLLWFRRTYRPTAAGFESRLEISQDLGKTWRLSLLRTYSRPPAGDDFFPVAAGIGSPSPSRATEGGEFDFLLGTFEATHWLKLGENERRWKANATAVYALGGTAILEFSWHDNDTTLPDAATTILRIYNRSMRRWESLFLTNRNNTPLHFGGVREGEQIVLHPFAAQTGSNPLFRWIFFDLQKDTYRWKGLQSTDRGKTFAPTWTIDFVRKELPATSAR